MDWFSLLPNVWIEMSQIAIVTGKDLLQRYARNRQWEITLETYQQKNDELDDLLQIEKTIHPTAIRLNNMKCFKEWKIAIYVFSAFVKLSNFIFSFYVSLKVRHL